MVSIQKYHLGLALYEKAKVVVRARIDGLKWRSSAESEVNTTYVSDGISQMIEYFICSSNLIRHRIPCTAVINMAS